MMKEKDIDLEGYVIRLADYKESDCIVNFISSTGLYAFHARGIKKPTSKNHILATLLVKAKLTLHDESESGKFVLKESKLLSFPDSLNDFSRMVCFQFLNELNSKLSDSEENLYSFLDCILSNSSNKTSLLPFCMIYFAQFLKGEGYGLNVDSCVFCNKKTDIIGVSLANGGFVCRDDIEYESEKREPRFLNILRFCFRCKASDMERAGIFNDRECLQIIAFLSELYEESTGVKIKSLEYLRRAA